MHNDSTKKLAATSRRRCRRAIVALVIVAPSAAMLTVGEARATPHRQLLVLEETSLDVSGAGSLFGTRIGANVRFGTPPREQNACRWRRVVGVDSLSGVYGPISRRMGDDMYLLVERLCVGPPPSSRQFWILDESSVSLATHASNEVVDNLPSPLVGLAPSAQKMVVNVGTWFWVSRAVWKPVSATAYLVTPEGVVWVRTTATPTRLVYSPGDGSGNVSTCVGPGRRWRTSFGDRLASPCMYTYAHASDGMSRRRFSARIGIEWRVSWKSNFGIRGVLPSVRTSTPISVRVHEIQALATN